jgi:hypothetical protein
MKKEVYSLKHDILMRSIKILDIGYITVIYVAFSMTMARLTDKALGKFDPKAETKKSVTQITLEMLLSLWLYGVMIYVVRNLAELIPFPLNGFQGFDHFRVKELKNATIFTFTFLMFCSFFKEKVLFYYKRVSQTPDGIGLAAPEQDTVFGLNR